jgi:putative SOS response-associated peptidase YedK
MLRKEKEVEAILQNLEPKLRFANGFEHPKMPILTSERFEQFNWGLVPSWIKTPEDAAQIRKQTLNAVSETVFEKPSFKSSIKTKRCLVPATGFFEWRHIGKLTFPYFISPSDDSVFWFAGIYNNCTIGDKNFNTFSILTTEANKLMAVIHNTKKRMPLILNEESANKWLDNNTSEPEIKNLSKPFPEDLMKAHPINRIKVSYTTEDTESAIMPFSYFELQELPPLS